MKYNTIRYYLSDLLREAHKWQYMDLRENGTAPKYYFSGPQFGILLISIIAVLLMPCGFDNDFSGYIISALSIFVGLFLSIILNVFDKFSDINFNPPNPSYNDLHQLKKKRNFFKQFTALTSYSIIISIFCILLLSSSLAFKLDHDIYKFKLVGHLSDVGIKTILNFIRLLIFLVYRFIIVYFLLDFILITIYAVTSYYKYIYSEYESVVIP